MARCFMCLFYQGCGVGIGVGVARSHGNEPGGGVGVGVGVARSHGNESGGGVGVGADHAALAQTQERLLEFVASLANAIENLLPFWN